MRGTSSAIVAVVTLSLGLACTTSVEISVDEREDFSQYRTWNWLPAAPRTIDAPTPYIIGLERALALLVAREFEHLGLERVDKGGDLKVGVLLNVRHEVVTIAETGAIEYLSSLHASPSFEVQTTLTREETHERTRLVIFAIDAHSRQVVWKGALEERFRGHFYPHLERTVANLLERFPSAGRSSESPGPRRDPGTDGPAMFSSSPSGFAPSVSASPSNSSDQSKQMSATRTVSPSRTWISSIETSIDSSKQLTE